MIAAGPLEPRYGGAVIFSAADEGWQAAVDAIVAADPYVANDVAQYEILGWKPTFGEARLR